MIEKKIFLLKTKTRSLLTLRFRVTFDRSSPSTLPRGAKIIPSKFHAPGRARFYVFSEEEGGAYLLFLLVHVLCTGCASPYFFSRFRLCQSSFKVRLIFEGPVCRLKPILMCDLGLKIIRSINAESLLNFFKNSLKC